MIHALLNNMVDERMIEYAMCVNIESTDERFATLSYFYMFSISCLCWKLSHVKGMLLLNNHVLILSDDILWVVCKLLWLRLTQVNQAFTIYCWMIMSWYYQMICYEYVKLYFMCKLLWLGFTQVNQTFMILNDVCKHIWEWIITRHVRLDNHR